MDAAVAYKYDNTFRAVVDQMRVLLSMYHITPAELRQAAMLAATMHDAGTFIRRCSVEWPDDKRVPIDQPSEWGWRSMETGRIQSGKPNFTVQDKQAGLDVIEELKPVFSCVCGIRHGMHTQTCNDYNWVYYQPKPLDGKCVTDRRVLSTRRVEDVYPNPRQRYERVFEHDRRKAVVTPKRQHTHYFAHVEGRNYRVCMCGMSNVYHNSILDNPCKD